MEHRLELYLQPGANIYGDSFGGSLQGGVLVNLGSFCLGGGMVYQRIIDEQAPVQDVGGEIKLGYRLNLGKKLRVIPLISGGVVLQSLVDEDIGLDYHQPALFSVAELIVDFRLGDSLLLGATAGAHLTNNDEMQFMSLHSGLRLSWGL